MFELLLLILGAVFVKKQVFDKPRAFTPAPAPDYAPHDSRGVCPEGYGQEKGGPNCRKQLPFSPDQPAPQPSYPVYQQPFAPDTGIGPGTGTQVLTPAKPTTPCPVGQSWQNISAAYALSSGAPTPAQWSCQPVRTSPMPHVTVRTIAANEGGGGCCEYVPKTTRILVEPCPPGQVRDLSGPICAMLCAERNDPNLQAVPSMSRCVGQGTQSAPGQQCGANTTWKQLPFKTNPPKYACVPDPCPAGQDRACDKSLRPVCGPCKPQQLPRHDPPGWTANCSDPSKPMASSRYCVNGKYVGPIY